MSKPSVQAIDAVRHFNRFYTNQIGLLNRCILNSEFSLIEARVLYELAQEKEVVAKALVERLNIDAGYLSRVLGQFAKRRLIRKKRSAEDGRQQLISLSVTGRRTFEKLDRASRQEIADMLKAKAPHERANLLSAMSVIEDTLTDAQTSRSAFVLRTHQPGDSGFVVHRHGVLYAREYGFDERFEGLVAEIVAYFIEHYDPKRERFWVAEQAGQIVGSVMVAAASKTAAQLRLLLVEPSARGTGLGQTLVEESLRFAQQAGYRKITLWTQDILKPARRLYTKCGFKRTRHKPHTVWGRSIVAETWERKLTGDIKGGSVTSGNAD